MNIFLNAHAGPVSFTGAMFQTAQDSLCAAILDRRWAKAEIVTCLHPILARQEAETLK